MKFSQLSISHLRYNKDHLVLDELLINIHKLERRQRFHHKIGFYNRVLSRTRKRLSEFKVFAVPGSGWVTPEGPLSFLYYEMIECQRLTEKLKLIEQILEMLSVLDEDYDEGTELFLGKLESELSLFLDDYDRLLEFGHSHSWLCQEFYSGFSLSKEIKNIKTRVRVLLKKIYRRFIMDMRQHIRCIVRFLFVKVDDEDVANVANVAVNVFAVRFIAFSNISINQNEKKRNIRSFIFN